jgi:hypothetical protein
MLETVDNIEKFYQLALLKDIKFLRKFSIIQTDTHFCSACAVVGQGV